MQGSQANVYICIVRGEILLAIGRSWQADNGLPVYPGRQAHEGAWLITLHSAYKPHIPGHGSRHLLLIHALSLGHSLFRTHSGLHPV